MDKDLYTVDYFIDKFKKIPDDKWITGEIESSLDESCHCALGHCGVKYKVLGEYYGEISDWTLTDESNSLGQILKNNKTLFENELHNVADVDNDNLPEYVWKINDCHTSDLGDHPKYRMINALMRIKLNNE